jgi:hypothetical protein
MSACSDPSHFMTRAFDERQWRRFETCCNQVLSLFTIGGAGRLRERERLRLGA